MCSRGPDSPLRPLQALGSLCSPWAAPRVGPLPPAPAMVRISKPKTFQAYLDDCHRRYSCAHCRAHLANHDDLISKVTRSQLGLEWETRGAAWQLPTSSPDTPSLSPSHSLVLPGQSGASLPLQLCVSIHSPIFFSLTSVVSCDPCHHTDTLKSLLVWVGSCASPSLEC